MKGIDLLVKLAERLLNTPVPKEHEVLNQQEEHGAPPEEDDPYKSVVAWCYVCRHQLGDEHDPSDLGCTYAPEE